MMFSTTRDSGYTQGYSINGNVIRRLNIYRVQVSVYERQSVQVGNNRRIPRTIDINSCSRRA